MKKTTGVPKKEISCKIEIYDPSLRELLIVLFQKDSGVKGDRDKKIKTKNTEREKLMNAAVFTDIPATIKKAGFHLDGSPKLAIAGLFDEKSGFCY